QSEVLRVTCPLASRPFRCFHLCMRVVPQLFAAALAALAAFGGGACKHEKRATVSVTAAPLTASAAPRVRRAKHGGTDVTFLAISDTHFGYEYPDDLAELSADPFVKPVGLEAVNVRLIKHANALAGVAYPKEIGGVVAAPRGLLAAGDLTEWGRREEW